MNENIILNTILNKIKNEYKEDISIFACYGSYVTGNYHELSDIDFFIIPKTEKGFQLSKEFIIDNIGYDLWGIPWDRIERIIDFEDRLISVLLDSSVLYNCNNGDLEKFNQIKNRAKELLENEDYIQNKCRQKIIDLKSSFFEVVKTNNINEIKNIEMTFLANCLTIFAFINNTYIKKGLWNLENEIKNYSILPVSWKERVNYLLKLTDKDKIILVLKEMIIDVENLINIKKQPDTFNANDLIGFYEELKSIYNKLFDACKKKNFLKVLYAAHTIDTEIKNNLKEKITQYNLPMLLQIAQTKDYKKISEACLISEAKILDVCKQNGIEIMKYKNNRDFSERF